MGKKKKKHKHKLKQHTPPLSELDAEEITTMRIEHPLQVMRGFKDKITEEPKKREALIKNVARIILDHSFLPYPAQYSENVANFLEQLDETEIATFYRELDETFGKILGEYENIMASMAKNKLDWKKALVKEENVSAKILSSIFGKKPTNEVEEKEEVNGETATEDSGGQESVDTDSSETVPDGESTTTEVPQGAGSVSG